MTPPAEKAAAEPDATAPVRSALPYTTLRPEAAVPAVCRPSLAFLDPTVAKAISEYANTGSVPASDLETLRRSTRRPRVATDRPVFRLGPNAPLVLNGNIVAAGDKDAGAAIVPDDSSGSGSLQDQTALRPRLLNTKLSHEEHEAYLKRRVLCTPFMNAVSQRLHFIQADSVISADLEEAQQQQQQTTPASPTALLAFAAPASALDVSDDGALAAVEEEKEPTEGDGQREAGPGRAAGLAPGLLLRAASDLAELAPEAAAIANERGAVRAAAQAGDAAAAARRPRAYTSPAAVGALSAAAAAPADTREPSSERDSGAAGGEDDAERASAGGRARGATVSGAAPSALASLRRRPMGLSAGRRASGWGVKRLVTAGAVRRDSGAPC